MATSDPVGRDPLAEKVDAWWLGVLSGEPGNDHPVYGSDLHAKLKGDILKVSGVLESENARKELEKEILTLGEGGIRRVRLKVEVVELQGDRGVLKQTILAFYTNAAQARMAERHLEGHSGLRPTCSQVLDAQTAADVLKEVAVEWRRELAEGFRKGKSLLLVEVDEIEVFRAAELLEETKSLEVLVLPPKVY
ncbi:MAG TPA: hypothetical protein VIL51_05040 [Thermoleophilia bacterium]